VERPSRLEGEPEAILGVSRSGTTLMRRVLDKHSRIGIATENHYLGHLLAREGARCYFGRVGDLRDDDAVRRRVELIYSGELQRRSRLRELSPYWRWLTDKVPREDIEAYLLASDRSERGVFEAFLRIYADRRGKAIMGEKTPAHLAYVETLLGWFPEGRVIHCMRDPRAIYVSELRRRYREQYRLVRFEDLVAARRRRSAGCAASSAWMSSHACWSRRSPRRVHTWARPGSTPVRRNAGAPTSGPGQVSPRDAAGTTSARGGL